MKKGKPQFAFDSGVCLLICLSAGGFAGRASAADPRVSMDGASVSATSSASGTSPAAAIDGKLDSRWASAKAPTKSSPEKITIDLGRAYAVTKIVVHSGTVYPIQDFVLKGQLENEAFSTLSGGSITGNANPDRAVATSATVRRLRLVCRKELGGTDLCRIRDLEVYGTPTDAKTVAAFYPPLPTSSGTPYPSRFWGKGILAFVPAAKSGTTMGYVEYLPAEYRDFKAPDAEKKVPLIVFFHGSGMTSTKGATLADVSKTGPLKYVSRSDMNTKGNDLPAVIVYPQTNDADRWANRTKMNRFLADMVARYNIDRRRIYITGLSLGGGGTWNMARYRTADSDGIDFAAAVPIASCERSDGTAGEAKIFASLPTWAFHNVGDPVCLLSGDKTFFNNFGNGSKAACFPCFRRA